MAYEAAADRYDGSPGMDYRFTGRSGLKLPALSLGLWQNFGTDRPEGTQRAILRRAFDRGIIHFHQQAINQDDEVVLSMRGMGMSKCRPS